MNHLGTILNQRLDNDDLRKNKGHSTGSVNTMFANFAMCSQLCYQHFLNDTFVVFVVILYGKKIKVYQWYIYKIQQTY